jgi:hypothetical protein
VFQNTFSDGHSRRHFFRHAGFGLAPVAAAWLLQQDQLPADRVKPNIHKQAASLDNRPTQSMPSANAMISLFMQGGPSQIDLLDPKPELNRLDGQKFPGTIKYDNAAQASSTVLGSPWKFRPRGESGTEISELLPHIAEIADDIVARHGASRQHSHKDLAVLWRWSVAFDAFQDLLRLTC